LWFGGTDQIIIYFRPPNWEGADNETAGPTPDFSPICQRGEPVILPNPGTFFGEGSIHRENPGRTGTGTIFYRVFEIDKLGRLRRKTPKGWGGLRIAPQKNLTKGTAGASAFKPKWEKSPGTSKHRGPGPNPRAHPLNLAAGPRLGKPGPWGRENRFPWAGGGGRSGRGFAHKLGPPGPPSGAGKGDQMGAWEAFSARRG